MATAQLEEKPAAATRLSGPQRVAVLILSLGEELSAEVFKRLTDEEVRLISQAIADLGVVDKDTKEAVLKDFHRDLVGGKAALRGDLEYVKRVVGSAYDPEISREILRGIAADNLPSSEAVKMLRKADPQLLAKVVQEEHPQTIAAVLAHLEPDRAAEVIALLPEDYRCDLCQRLADLDQISQPVRDKVTDILASKLREGGEYDQHAHGGLRTVAEIFNRMDRNVSQQTLELIEQQNPKLALAIRNLMFVFDDILLISDADMRKVIQQLDKRVLVKALKGTSEELKEHFFRNMSQRAASMLMEDIEALGPIKLKDAEAARQEIVAAIRQMESEGVIDLAGTGGDQYVV